MTAMMSLRKKKKEFCRATFRPRGITLIEILFGTAVGCFSVLSMLNMYVSSQKYVLNENQQADAVSDARYLVDWIARDIKAAARIVPGWQSYLTSSSSLVLQVPAVDTDGLIIDAEQCFDYIIYKCSGGRLERIIDADDGFSGRSDRCRVFAGNVSSVQFKFFAADGTELSAFLEHASTVDVSLLLMNKGANKSFQEGFNSQAKLRNRPTG
jgi:hypothetical protein